MERILTFILILLLILSVNISGLAEITEDMIVGAWLFDGDAKDISANGFDGEAQGGKYVEGKIGKAIELNGTTEWVNIPKRLGSFEEITFTHWVKCTGRDNGWRVFFNVNGWKGGDIHYQLHPDNRVEFSINGNPGGSDQFATFRVTGGELNKWIHIATAYSVAEKKIRFYINGELNAENDWGGNPGVLDPGKIGAWTDANGQHSRFWQGMIDEFIIFNTVLSEVDINSVMNDGLESGLAVDPKAKLATTWGNIKQ